MNFLKSLFSSSSYAGNRKKNSPGTCRAKAKIPVILITLLFLIQAAAVFAGSGEVYFARTPAVSPDGGKIVFSYDEDLWLVDASGGTAYRITAMQGRELFPRFSPDGKWLAFSAAPSGNLDVYVMPVSGGDIKQLTFHSSADRVDSWSWDSKNIYFNSGRFNDFSEFKVSVGGGTPQRLFGANYFSTVHGLVEHPRNGAFYFTDTWESFNFAHRKRYKGDYNPDIKSYHPKRKEFKVHTTYRGKDFAPTIDKHGNIYFLSDRDNDEYNLYTFKNKKIQRLTNFPVSIQAPNVSADGNLIVFEKGYQLFTYEVKTGKTEKLPVKLFNRDKLSTARDFNVKGKITAFDVSTDGKKIAFVSRGELFVSDIKGKFTGKPGTAVTGRVMEVKWLADNKTILFSRTVEGWLNLFKIRADKKEPGKQLTFDKANNRDLSLNSDRSKAVYLSGRNYLKIIDLKTFKSKQLVKDEFWGFYNSQPYFSPDDRWVVFCAYRNFEKDILVYNLKSGKTVNLTASGMSEDDPYWSPDGKYMFFSADRYEPDYPRGGRNNKIYRLALEKYDTEYRSQEFDKLFQEEKKDKQEKDKKKDAQSTGGDLTRSVSSEIFGGVGTFFQKGSDPPEAITKKASKGAKETTKKTMVSFDFEDMIERWQQVSPRAGGQRQPFVICKKGVYTVLYISNHDGERGNIWKTTIKPFEPRKTEKIKGAKTWGLNISAAKDKYYVLLNGVINELDLTDDSVKPIKMDYTFRRNLAGEFTQMFSEVWANLQENYYDEKFHGLDWEKTGKQYKKFLPHIRTRADLRRLINDMLGELNSSHLGFTSRGDEEKTFYKTQTEHTGIIFQEDSPYRVKYVVKGSAADKKGIDIKPGDGLTAVNGQKIDPEKNRESYFTAPSLAKEIKLTFSREKKGYSVNIHPESNRFFKRHLYNEWERENQDYVDKKSSKRIAYIHMKNMGRFSLRQFIVEMSTEAFKKEALILDLRFNTGGNVHDAVLEFLSRKPYTKWKYRGGKFAPQPNFAPAAKPIVLLINEQSLSDAEMTAAGFKALELGTVIGTETYRWLIFTSGKDLVDGSFYRLPSWGCYTLEGKDIEWHGVAPDIYVKKTLEDRLENRYPQLDTAIKEINKKLKK